MMLEFPDDPAVSYVDRQYLLGPDLLVAPVFRADGRAEFYLPAGRWTSVLTGETVEGGTWRREVHGFDSLPLYARDGAVLAVGSRVDRPDYDYFEDLTLELYPASEDSVRSVRVVSPTGQRAEFRVARSEGRAIITSEDLDSWTVRVVGGSRASTSDGRMEIQL